MADTQHFCLRWNNYQSSITSAFENLRDDEDFVDVTLACDGKSLKAHRVVLSACSPYFRELLKSTPCKHPVIVLQDVAFADLHALVEFIYHGEVNVHQRNLTSFLKTAEVLRVSGLTQQAEDRDEVRNLWRIYRTCFKMKHFSEKLVEDALFTSPPSPLPSSQHSNATSGGATVNQLLRRAAAAAAIASSSSRRERHNSAEQQSDSSEQSQHSSPSKRARTSVNVENNNHNNGDGDSTPSPTSGMLDGVKSEPLELMCGAADMDNSNDSVEAAGGDVPAGSHQQSSLSAGDHDDHDSIQGHPGSVYLSTPESKLFTSATSTGSFNFSMAGLSEKHTVFIFRAEDGDSVLLQSLASTNMSGTKNQKIIANLTTVKTSSQKERHFSSSPDIKAIINVKLRTKFIQFKTETNILIEIDGMRDAYRILVTKPEGRRNHIEDLGIGSPKKVFTCQLCGKVLCSKASLKRHIADKHAERQEEYRCVICERVYCSRNSLMTHIYTYHKTRPGEVDIKFF
ncbi:Broad-complex core protein isoform 6 [Zootermopsis nevadensis]|uniref:Broad-complex core protein isoform 6 n=1 Tax=Zootermopsis nevadensis TaxID=136037 RepID=A0A067QVG7_ZOONE|nr:Broad-complex core protein isoform 6 [Zootermopsis nevadensis]